MQLMKLIEAVSMKDVESTKYKYKKIIKRNLYKLLFFLNYYVLKNLLINNFYYEYIIYYSYLTFFGTKISS